MNSSSANSSSGSSGSSVFADNGMSKFQAYDSQMAIPEVEGTRIVKCLYKTMEGKEKTRESAFLRVPCDHLNIELISSRFAEIAPYVLEFLQSKEDELIKEEHKKGVDSFYIKKLSFDLILAHLENSETGGRLNKEVIVSWFKDNMETFLIEGFAQKMGIDIETCDDEVKLGKIAAIINAYKEKFISLSSGRTLLKAEDKAALIAILIKNEIAAKTVIGSRLLNKLEKMEDKTADLLALL
jgi:hypothetical protein